MTSLIPSPLPMLLLLIVQVSWLAVLEDRQQGYYMTVTVLQALCHGCLATKSLYLNNTSGCGV